MSTYPFFFFSCILLVMAKAKNPKKSLSHRRNGSLFDAWSITHILWAMLLAWIMNPFIALSIMVLWEPLEVFVLCPLLARYGISFGYESIQNSLSDIFFDVIGVFLGAYVLSNLIDPPFFLF